MNEPEGVRLRTALLIAGPGLMVVGRVLLAPFDDSDFGRSLQLASQHGSRNAAGWFTSLVACGLLAATVVHLGGALRAAGRVIAGNVVTVLGPVGWVGCAGLCTWGMLLTPQGEAPDRAAQIAVVKAFNDGAGRFVFLAVALGAVAYVTAAVSLSRAGLVGRMGGFFLGFGGATTLLTMSGPKRPLLVAVAVVLLVAHVLLLRVAGAARSARPETAVP